ncbi:hypothetical protein C6500_11495 [Candidatus Poribacteria bacterium]|nr:MAG: hypothetical protein C6500_11495 [Candidatus Poribacteria bacterium]
MSYNKQKMVKLILNECESIDQKCDGYRKKVLDAIIDILNAERQHRVQRTQIQQKVNETCHQTGDFLAQKQGTDTQTTEVTK